MIRVIVRELGEQELTFVFDQEQLVIGRAMDNDLALPRSDVSKRHARARLAEGKLVVADLASENGTYVNGMRITSPTPVSDDDRVQIGQFTLRLEGDAVDTREVEATELRLLLAVVQHEAGSREVYADWLEERGDTDRAELLRLQEEGKPCDRLRELAARSDLAWRFKVARAFVEGCEQQSRECEWSALAITQRGDVRHCTRCQRDIYYCATLEEARERTRRRELVVVDAAAVRSPYDLYVCADDAGSTVYVDPGTPVIAMDEMPAPRR